MRLLIISCFLMVLPLEAGTCVGRLVNPLTDICWKCVFPIRIAGQEVARGGADPTPIRRPLCLCPKPPLGQPTPGLPVSFWEPVRMVDVTRTPFCMVNLGGIQMGSQTGVRNQGDVTLNTDDMTKQSFYHVHWYVYPILYWMEVLMDLVCLEKLAFDIAYLTELDPFWNDDEKSAILNPEGILFGNPIAQAACAADCVAASAHLPLDPLFWCGGCQGSVYPFTGTVTSDNGGVQTSLLLVTRMMAKLHREVLLWGYMGEAGLCGRYPMPLIRKSQYRVQMLYPAPTTHQCFPLGATELLWQAGREFPYKGEDFGYMVWRKRDCCLL